MDPEKDLIAPENKEKEETTKSELQKCKSEIIESKLNNLEISTSSKQILDLLKNKADGTETNMYQKLEKLEGVDFNIEKFAKDIDITVKKFLYQSFFESKGTIKVADGVINSMSVGIQFAMMETLTDSGKNGSDFFSSFSDLKVGDSGNILDGLMNVFGSGKGLFGKIGNVNKFYTLANKFQNCVNYVSYHSGKGKDFGDGSKINELMNGNKFRKTLDNPIWETSEGLISKKRSEVGLTSSDGLANETSDNDKLELQNIADNVNMPIDLKTINSIKTAIPTAQNLLEKRFTYKSNISGLIDKVGSLLNINLLGLGTIGSLLGIKSPIDFFRSKKGEKKGILDFILTGMGFQGGVEGLHREYVRKNIDENLDSKDKKVLISDLYKFYDKEKQPEYKGKNTVDKFGLSKMDEGLKNKIPAQYDVLKQTLTEKIKGKEKLINPGVLVKYGQKDCVLSEKFKDINGNEKTRLVIDETKFDKSKIDEKFMDKYLSDNIKTLIVDEKFMSDIENADQFALALMGNLVAGSWFIEGVVIGEELVDSYLNDDPTTQNDGKVENLESEGVLVFSDKIPENKEEFVNKVKTIASSLNINPNWLMLVMDIETGGKFDHKIQNTDSGATGLIQFMPKTAEGLGTTTDKLKTMSNLEQLDYVEKYYKQYQTSYPVLKIASYEDLYMVTFYPEALGKDNSYVLGSTTGNAGLVAKQNPAINVDKDLVITKGELSNFIKQNINERIPEEFKRNFA